MDQRQVWEEIGDGWKGWRQRPLEEVKIVKEMAMGRRIIDIGGGNGRNLKWFEGWERVVVDFSRSVMEGRSNVLADMRALPFPDRSFDVALMINSIHCLEEGREIAVKEAWRVLKEGGLLMISAWNRWERRFFPRNLFSPDICVPWRKKGRKVMRFYHLFSRSELEGLVEDSGFRVVMSFKGWDSKESWFVIAEKHGYI